jgi:hypothetical protein
MPDEASKKSMRGPEKGTFYFSGVFDGRKPECPIFAPQNVPFLLPASGDNSIAPNDALMVINFINAQGAGEGEASTSSPPVEAAMLTGATPAGEQLSGDLLTLLAFDTAPLSIRRR